MPDADKYEPGGAPTKTKDRRGFGTSATGSNAGPNLRALNPDALQGTTSAESPELHKKPEKGSRLDPDT